MHNGTDPRARRRRQAGAPAPSSCVVGRLVPHKQVEHAIDAVARAARASSPTCACTSSGSGWWEAELQAVRRADAAPATRASSTGTSTSVRKQEIYEASWVMALPSLKEGWGLVVGEAAMHGTPTVAYRAAGGTRESIDHGVSGLLADSYEEFVAALADVLGDPERAGHAWLAERAATVGASPGDTRRQRSLTWWRRAARPNSVASRTRSERISCWWSRSRSTGALTFAGLSEDESDGAGHQPDDGDRSHDAADDDGPDRAQNGSHV